MEIGWSIVLGLLGAAALWGLYRALELNWPEQYSSLNDTFALKITQTWWRFLSFRFVPIFVAAVAVAVTTSRLGGIPGLAVVLMTVIHISHTNFRAIVDSATRANPSGVIGVNYSPFHFATIIVVGTAALLGLLASPALANFIPRPHVLIENLWIAVFVTVVGALAVSVIGRRPDGSPTFGSTYFVARAAKDIGLQTVDVAYKIALEEQCDPLLLRAIMFTESLQRPRWVRRLERAKGRFFKRGSYGVTQEGGERPHSDEESLRITAKRISGSCAAELGDYGWQSNDGVIWRHAAGHNPDSVFIGTVQEIYRELLSPLWNNSIYLSGEPGSLLVHVFEVRRYPHEFCLRGFASGESIEVSTAESSAIETRVNSNPTKNKIWAFEIPIPVEAKSVRFLVRSPDSAVVEVIEGTVTAAMVRS